MREESFLIEVHEGLSVTAVRTQPDSSAAKRMFLYAPGAGSNIGDPFGGYLNHRLAESGIATLRFQFPYMEAGKRRPDSPRLLEETWRRVIAMVEEEGTRLAVGGRSKGGRIASQVVAQEAVAQGSIVDGLALFAYPLGPPRSAGKPPGKRRDEHLPGINVPTLFCSGTRDASATPEQLREASAAVPVSTVQLLDGADHGFAVLKSSGRTREDVWNDATGHLLDWLGSLGWALVYLLDQFVSRPDVYRLAAGITDDDSAIDSISQKIVIL